MTLYDISVPIENGMVTWPGDPSVEIERRMDIACGDAVTVSNLNAGVHTGTHVDAFSHFLEGGESLDQMDLSPYLGKALVIEVLGTQVITEEELRRHAVADYDRILFKTDNSKTLWSRQPFDEHFCHLHPQAAQYLIQQNVKLVGVDYLSVESYHSQTLYGKEFPGNAPVHHLLLKAGIYILEGLYLGDVSAGEYELLALPLKLMGVDGAPTRAVLRELH